MPVSALPSTVPTEAPTVVPTTPPTAAPDQGCDRGVARRLAAGADADAASRGGTTPLQLAEANGHEELLKALRAALKPLVPDGPSPGSAGRLRAAARTLRKGAQLRVELTGPDCSVRKDGASANSAPQRLLRALAAGIKSRKSDRVQAERI